MSTNDNSLGVFEENQENVTTHKGNSSLNCIINVVGECMKPDQTPTLVIDIATKSLTCQGLATASAR